MGVGRGQWLDHGTVVDRGLTGTASRAHQIPVCHRSIRTGRFRAGIWIGLVAGVRRKAEGVSRKRLRQNCHGLAEMREVDSVPYPSVLPCDRGEPTLASPCPNKVSYPATILINETLVSASLWSFLAVPIK